MGLISLWVYNQEPAEKCTFTFFERLYVPTLPHIIHSNMFKLLLKLITVWMRMRWWLKSPRTRWKCIHGWKEYSKIATVKNARAKHLRLNLSLRSANLVFFSIKNGFVHGFFSSFLDADAEQNPFDISQKYFCCPFSPPPHNAPSPLFLLLLMLQLTPARFSSLHFVVHFWLLTLHTDIAGGSIKRVAPCRGSDAPATKLCKWKIWI